MSHQILPGRSCHAILVSLALASVGPMFAWADVPEPVNGRVLTIEEAIDIAKRCILERSVRVVGSFIESARFDRNPGGDRGPFWRVTWAYSSEIKGGQVFVTVLLNRTCEVTYGE